MTEAAARERLARFRAQAAVVYGSGLEALPPGARVEDELAYPELGWPCTAVPGHAGVVRLVSGVAAGKARLRLALACGRPHLYEGWSDDELQRPVRDLAAAGVRRVVLTNSTGSLRQDIEPGDIVVCGDLVDLQAPPAEAEPPRLEVCPPEAAEAVAASLVTAGERGATIAGVHTGTYVAVAGPQFETRAEVAWLAGYGDVVGMSAAPEVRAMRAAGAECCLLALVVNRAAAVGSHEAVLAFAGSLAVALSANLVDALQARWPGLV